jgi:hypothetical protein
MLHHQVYFDKRLLFSLKLEEKFSANNFIRLKVVKISKPARYWWSSYVILAIQEAEIRRITEQSQPWANQFLRPYLKKTCHKKDWWSGLRCKP